MMIAVMNLDRGKEIYINPAYIVRIEPLEEESEDYCRVWLTGDPCWAHIRVGESMTSLRQKIQNNETYEARYILGSEIAMVRQAIQKLTGVIKK